MLLFLPTDVLPLLPSAAVIDKLLLDFDLLDLAWWFPHLSWNEFGRAFGAFFACKLAGDQVERWALAPVKARAKTMLACWCALRWPTLSRWFKQSN